MKVKTESLTGLHLDVAVAIAIGGEVTRPQDAQVYLNGMHQLCGEESKRHSERRRELVAGCQRCADCQEEEELRGKHRR